MLLAKDQVIKKLQIIQNKAIKIAFRLHPRSRTNEMHKLAEIPLIKTRLEELSTSFICSLNENSELFKHQNIIRAARIKRGQKTLLDKLQNIYKEHHNWIEYYWHCMLVCVLEGGVDWRPLTELSVKVRSVLTAAARRDEPHDNRRNYSLNRCRVNVGPTLKRHRIDTLQLAWGVSTHTQAGLFTATQQSQQKNARHWGVSGPMLAQLFQRWADIGPPPQRGHSGNIPTIKPAISLHTCTITQACIQYTPRRQAQQTQWINTLTPKSK